MTPRRRYTFYIDPAQRAALTTVKVRDGIPESEQIRRAIALWLDSKGVTMKSGRTRKRSTSQKGGA